MTSGPPIVVVIAGPNGAGKSTVARDLLWGALGVVEFVDADQIARGLSAFNAESAAIAAGRVMLTRLRELARERVSFAFETTLASRSFARWLHGLKASGYAVHLFFLWLPSADLAVARVAQRVRAGGHGVPETTVRRRYAAGLQNFFRLYKDLAASWRAYDASGESPRLIAARLDREREQVYDPNTWRLFKQAAGLHET